MNKFARSFCCGYQTRSVDVFFLVEHNAASCKNFGFFLTANRLLMFRRGFHIIKIILAIPYDEAEDMLPPVLQWRFLSGRRREKVAGKMSK